MRSRRVAVAGNRERERPVNAGDDECILRILERFESGAEVEGWALYWSHLYGHVADRLEASPSLRQASFVVHYEDLCTDAHATLQSLLEHCRLAPVPGLIEGAARKVHFPDYYRLPFTTEEHDLIERLTSAVAARLRSREQSAARRADRPLATAGNPACGP